MQITKKKSFSRQSDGTYLGRDVYRLTKELPRQQRKGVQVARAVLGALEGLTKTDRQELASMLTMYILLSTHTLLA